MKLVLRNLFGVLSVDMGCQPHKSSLRTTAMPADRLEEVTGRWRRLESHELVSIALVLALDDEAERPDSRS